MPNFDSLIAGDDLLPESPYGEWGGRPGFLMQVEKEGTTSPHIFGGPEGKAPICSCCAERMHTYATIDLADAEVSLILGAPSAFSTLTLPYCAGCNSVQGVSFFRIDEAGNVPTVLYQNTPPSVSRFRPVIPKFSNIPMRLKRILKSQMPLNEDSYLANIEVFGGGRCQLGGAPLFPSTPIGFISPQNGRLMQFVASISENDELASKIGVAGLGLSGVLLFFVDWDEGVLASVFQQ